MPRIPKAPSHTRPARRPLTTERSNIPVPQARPQRTQGNRFVHGTHDLPAAQPRLLLTGQDGGIALHRTQAVSQIQPVTRHNSVSLDPYQMLGNLHNGQVQVELPLDKSLLSHRSVSLRDDAKVKVNFVLKEGQIDFERSRVELDGVKALGLLNVRGAYFNKKGKLKLDMSGPDINISKALTGQSRVPQDMQDLARALEAKSQASASESQTPGTGMDLNGLNGLRFSATGISLRPDAPLALGTGNEIRLTPDTRVDVSGTNSQVAVRGRVGLERMTLGHGPTGVDLGPGQVKFEASAARDRQGNVDAKVDLQHLNLTANKVSHALEGSNGVDLRDATLCNGSLRASVRIDSQGQATLPALQTKGEFAAKRVTYTDGERTMMGHDLHVKLDASVSVTAQGTSFGEAKLTEIEGQVSHMSVPGKDGRPMVLRNAFVEGGHLERTRANDGSFNHRGGVAHFEGEVNGASEVLTGGFQGTIGANDTKAEGSFQFENQDIDSRIHVARADVGLDDASVRLDGIDSTLNIKSGRWQSDQGTELRLNDRKIDIAGSGHLTGELNRSTLKLGDVGALTFAAGTKAEMEVESARLGSLLGSGEFKAKGRLQGRLESGDLQIGGSGHLDLRGADFDFKLDKIEVGADKPVSIAGDLKLKVDAGATIDRGLLNRVGIDHVEDAQGSLSLNLKDAAIDGSGQVSVGHGQVELKASVGEIRGRIELPDLGTTGESHPPNGNLQSSDEIKIPELALRPSLTEPLNLNPLDVAKRIENGAVELEIPLQEKGLEDASKVWGVKTVDFDPNTKLKAKLVVENGEIQYDKSEFSFSHAPEALGFLDLKPRLNDKGEVRMKVAGLDINLTKHITGQKQLPRRISTMMQQLSPGTASAGSSELNPNAALNQAQGFVKLSDIQLNAKGVALSQGRLQIGDNDYIELGADNRLDLSGSGRQLNIQGRIAAQDAYVDLGDTQVDLGEGQVDFSAKITTGLSASGQMTKPSSVDFEFKIPQAKVDHMRLNQPDGQRIELRSGEIRDAVLRSSQHFTLNDEGHLVHDPEASRTSLSVPHFSGDLGQSRLGLRNPDGSQGLLSINAARSEGNFSVNAQGEIQSTLRVDALDAQIDDLQLNVPGAQLRGLDGTLSGQGTFTLDSTKGLTLDGNFKAGASLEDGRVALDGVTDLDLSRESRAQVNITKLDTTTQTPLLQGTLDLEAGLDSGQVSIPGAEALRFAQGSKLKLQGVLGADADGGMLTMKGEVLAQLGNQRFRYQGGNNRIEGEVYDGFARIDLGDITVHDDGRYRLVDPEVKLQMDLNLLGRQD